MNDLIKNFCIFLIIWLIVSNIAFHVVVKPTRPAANLSKWSLPVDAADPTFTSIHYSFQMRTNLDTGEIESRRIW